MLNEHPEINVDSILNQLSEKYKNEQLSTIDGVKIDFANEWVHFRKSNTEPIIRIYTESTSQDGANQLAKRFITEIENLI